MRTILSRNPLLIVLLLLVAACSASAQQNNSNVIAAATGPIWRYNQVEDVTINPNWNNTNYNDSTWQSGPGGFSYETGANDVRHDQSNPAITLVRTALNNPANDPAAQTRHARFFRYTFVWTNGPVHSLFLHMRWDDSGYIYLNGQLIYNNSGQTLPIPWTFNTARGAIDPDTDGKLWEDAIVEVSTILQPGTNVIAVANHQVSATSSDVVFVCGISALLPFGPFIDNLAEPTNRVVVQSRSTTLRMLASGFPNPTYQWYFQGNPIDSTVNPTATNASLLIAHMALTDVGEYFCRASNLNGGTNSRTATVGYTADLAPPTVVSASSVLATEVSVLFNEEIDPGTGGDAINYSIPGGPIVTNAVLQPGGQGVRLQLDGPVTSPFTVNITDVADYAGNTIAGGASATGSQWADSGDIGSPTPVGNAFSPAPGTVDVTAGGADIWGAADQFHFVYNQRSGDFDVKVKVQRLDAAQRWSKGGLLARETLDGASATIHTYTTPVDPPGNHGYEVGIRTNSGGATVSWELSPLPQSELPNAWVRLRRNGDTWRAYHGSNGTDWVLYGGPRTQVMTPDLYVGPAATSHNVNQTTFAEFRSFGNFTYPGAGLAFSPQPSSQTVQQHEAVTFTSTATASGAPQSEIHYQWQRSDDGVTWANIAGANGTSFGIAFPEASDGGDRFRLVASIPGATVNSAAATLTLTPDTRRPHIRSVIGVSPTKAIIFFDEPMAASAGDPFAYTIDQGITVGDAILDANDPMRVNLDISIDTQMTPGTTYTLTASGAQNTVVDSNGNVISPDPATATFVAQNYSGDPSTLRYLPTNSKRALGSLTTRGFKGRYAQALAPTVHNIDTAQEPMLAGTYVNAATGAVYPNVAPVTNFIETTTINYNNNIANPPVVVGHFSPDRQFPGYTSAQDMFCFEMLTYVEFRAGIYHMGVSSDDGFRVTPATGVTDPNNSIILGQFNDPAGRGVGDTAFDFIVVEDGLYPMRLLWEEGGGDANVEWWVQSLVDSSFIAINDDRIKAFQPPVSTVPRITLTRGATTITLSWTDQSGTYQLQSSPSLAPANWTNLSGATGAGGNYSITITPASTGARYYRLRSP